MRFELKKLYVLSTIMVLILSFISCSSSGTDSRPNILLVMSDDHAKAAISRYNDQLIQTPNIDRLAEEGLIFENAFVTNSICAPSRAVILTGKYSHLNGLRDNRDVFNPNQTTFPGLLQKAGYFTSIIGKWHLKSTPRDFHYWKILPGQGHYYNPTFIEMGDTLQVEGYVTNLITDYAIQTLEKRDKDRPFCMLLYHKAPHRNWMPDLKHLNLFNETNFPLPSTFYDEYKTRSAAAREQDMEIAKLWNSFDLKLEYSDERKENTGGQAGADPKQFWEGTYGRFTMEQKTEWDKHYKPVIDEFRKKKLSGKALTEWKYQRYIKDYLRCIVSVDENIGRVLDYLDRSGLAENTIVIYTSDQGFYLGEHGWYDKRFMYEESMGTPLIVRYPKLIHPGSVSDDLVLNLDFAPTLLDMAGVEIPVDMQGLSLLPILRDDKEVRWRDAVYYHYYEYPHGWHDVKRHYGVRTDRYKLIHFYNDIDAWELYDLQEDSHEMNNLYNNPSYAEKIKELKNRLRELQEQYQDL